MTNEISIIGVVEEVSVKPGFNKMTNKSWKRSVVKAGGKNFSTFDEGIADSIMDGSLRSGIAVEINFVSDGKYNTIKTIFPTTQPIPQNQYIPQLMPGERATPNKTEPDWEAIARGKVRNSIASALIQSQGLIPLTSEVINMLESYVDYVMNGKTGKKDGQVNADDTM